MCDVNTITKSDWENLLPNQDSGIPCHFRTAQRYLPVNAEYVPKLPEELIPT